MKRIKNNILHTDIETEVLELGESLETQIRRLTANNEPIPGVFPDLFTPAKDGVIADTDIRADRFEIARQANDKYLASETAKAATMGTKFDNEEVA